MTYIINIINTCFTFEDNDLQGSTRGLGMADMVFKLADHLL